MRRHLLLVICLLWLAACNPSPASVSFMVFGDPVEYAAYEALVAAFEIDNPEIDVVLSHIPSQGDYRTKLSTAFAAGAPPDVALLSYRRVGAFAAADQLEPLGPYLDGSDVIGHEDFYPITLAAFTWQGELLCIPQNISSLVVYYNRDLFAAAGVSEPADDWTWDDFVAAAVVLTDHGNGSGLEVPLAAAPEQYGLGIEPSLYRLAPFVWQNGGRIVDDPAYPTQLGLTRAPSLAALEWFVALQTVHGVVPDRVAEAAIDSETRFVQGTTAMFLNSRRGTPTYRESAAFDWDIAPLPRGVAPAGVLHSDAYCLAAAAEDKDAAWRFIEFANSPAGQTIVARSGRTVPSLIAVAESDTFLNPAARPSRSQVFLDTVGDLQMVPLLSTWEDIEATASEEIERAFYGDITAEEAAILARDRTEEYFALGARP